MTHGARNTPDARIEAYLDGALSPAERAAFERDAAGDRTLAAQLELQRRVDGSLARLFEAPPEASPVAPSAGSSAPTPAVRNPLRVFAVGFAAAAALLVGGAALWSYIVRSQIHLVPPQRVYDTLIADGFKPQWRCESDEEFARAVKDQLGIAMVVPMSTPGVQLVGWGYGSSYTGYTLSRDTMILLARVADDAVVVLVDRASRDRELAQPASGGLSMFRREVGGLVLYEVTPRNEPAITPAATLWE